MEINNKVILENSKNLNILYVEDDEDIRKSTSLLLANFFNSVDTAEDGEQGYKKYAQHFKNNEKTYDIVFSDISMPNMNGLEMIEKIREINHDQALIIITAFNEPEYLSAAIELGINGFLTKPIEIEQFKHVIHKTSQIVSDRNLVKKHYQQIEDLNMLNINKIDARSFTSAKDILSDLQSNKENISKLWTNKDEVQARLGAHYIDVEFFRTHYALKVIEYFLNVIRGEAELGNCPVIFIMLDFFKNKDLPLKDIFMICVLFKNTVTAYVFDRYTFNHALFDDISLILDKNFEGVIINYLDMKYTSKETPHVQKKVQAKPVEEETEIVENIIYKEYVLEHDLYELQDLEEDIDSLAISITESSSSTVDDFTHLGAQIEKYGAIVSNYPIFADLGKCIVKLGVNFSANAQLLFDDRERMTNIASLIEGFVNDLIIWRREVFDNNVEDPHFLNQSFFSNVDTIIMFIEYDESASPEEDDFDDMFF